MNEKKRIYCLLLALALCFIFPLAAQAAEADLVVLVGDIDNLGFGWPEGFDVFSGQSTPGHSYPWEARADDAPGTDRIMVGTSYRGNPPAGEDGYTGSTARPGNWPEAIKMKYNLNGIQVKAATLQMFVDDFQVPVWQSKMQVTINGKRAGFLEDVLNSLNQTGPIGKLITVQVPAAFLAEVAKGELEICIDDPTTGAGDGYAVDFVRLLINPYQYKYTGQVLGKVVDKETGNPLAGVILSAGQTIESLTIQNGSYLLKGVPAGLAVIKASKPGYLPQILTVNLEASQKAELDFELSKAPVSRDSGRVSAMIGGISHYDMLSSGEGFKEDGALDVFFVADLFDMVGKTITGVEIRNINGLFSVWDTTPNNGMWVLGIAKAEKPSHILNESSGIVKIPVEKNKEKLYLYATDNGSFAGKNTDYQLIISFSDGSKIQTMIERENTKGNIIKL